MRAIFGNTYLKALFGGGLFALGFPSIIGPSLVITPILGHALLFREFIALKNSLLKQLLLMLAFSTGFNLVGFYWIGHTLTEFGELPLVVSYFLGLLFSFFILPHMMLIPLLLWLIKKYSSKQLQWLKNYPMTQTLLAAFSITVLEYTLPQQFPVYIGQSWLGLGQNLSLAPILGLVAFNFFSFWLSLNLARCKRDRKNLFVSLFFCLFLALNLFIPLTQKEDTSTPTSGIWVRIVQANIGNLLKLSSEEGGTFAINTVKDRYSNLSLMPSAHTKNFDLIVWPETAFPHSLSVNRKDLDDTLPPPTIKYVTEKSKSALLFGGYNIKNFWGDQFESQFNTAFLFNKEGKIQDYYHKRILIPFGETLPFGPLNPVIYRFIPNIAFFGKGDHFTHFHLKDDISFITPICYEILSKNFMAQYLNAHQKPADFIINLTNDSWYGDTAEPHQHLFLTKWIALQFNIPIIRSTNTGITSIIFPDGSESKRLGVGQKGVLDQFLKLNSREATPYQRWGIWLTVGSVFLIGFPIFFWERKKRTFSN